MNTRDKIKYILSVIVMVVCMLLAMKVDAGEPDPLPLKTYLPLILNNPPDVTEYVPPVGPTPTPTPVPIEYVMAVTFENNTGGPICYGIEGIKDREDCVEANGKVFYGSIPMGNYNFWGKGCDDTQILGNANLLYRSATISFGCFDFAGKSTIWAKMYEMK